MGKRIILASQSPRRKMLMRMAGIRFSVKSKNVSEEHPASMNAEIVPSYLAERKASAFINEMDDDTIVIGADTIVLLEGKIYGKPSDKAQAISMLKALNGKMHRVITGVCILSSEKKLVFSETTKVFFNRLTDAEIKFYVERYKPFDKAGAYACQEWIGAVGIRKFEGDYFNVMGLPINRVYRELKKFN